MTPVNRRRLNITHRARNNFQTACGLERPVTHPAKVALEGDGVRITCLRCQRARPQPVFR